MQPTISKYAQSAVNDSIPRRDQPVEAVRVANSPAALDFNVAGILSAALAIAAAALFYHGTSSNAVLGAAFGCLGAVVVLQVAARRRLREELIKDARQCGATDPEAVVKECMGQWLEHRCPTTGAKLEP